MIRRCRKCKRRFLRMSKLKSWLKRETEQTSILLKSIPATVVTLFVVSVVCMNLLANKTLLQLPWIALDGGILISWLSFMCMDIITKHFGPGASNRICVLASAINLLTCLIFFTAAVISQRAWVLSLARFTITSASIKGFIMLKEYLEYSWFEII